MPDTARRGIPRLGNAMAVAAAFLGGVAAPGFAADLRVGPFAGVVSLDSQLADFRWDVTPRTVWGVSAAASFGRPSAGVRFWRARTTQSTGLPGSAPTVRLTGSEVFGELALASVAGTRLSTTGSFGLLHLGYSPDRLTVDVGTGEPVEVEFDPIAEAMVGLGVALRRHVAGGLEAGIAVRRTWFRLDTTYRSGNEIVERRDTFGQWSAHLELSHRILHL